MHDLATYILLKACLYGGVLLLVAALIDYIVFVQTALYRESQICFIVFPYKKISRENFAQKPLRYNMYFSIPFIAYFIALLWTAFFGDTIVYWYEKNMLEEYVISCVLTLVFMVLYKSRRKDEE